MALFFVFVLSESYLFEKSSLIIVSEWLKKIWHFAQLALSL